MHHPDPAGQRLRNAYQEAELLRTGQHVGAGVKVGVDLRLQVGEEPWDPLRFIQDDTVGEAGEKPARIAFGQESGIGIFQRQIRLVRESGPGKGGLPRLARSRNGNDRKAPGQAYERSVCCSSNYNRRLRRPAQFVKQFYKLYKMVLVDAGELALVHLESPVREDHAERRAGITESLLMRVLLALVASPSKQPDPR